MAGTHISVNDLPTLARDVFDDCTFSRASNHLPSDPNVRHLADIGQNLSQLPKMGLPGARLEHLRPKGLTEEEPLATPRLVRLVSGIFACCGGGRIAQVGSAVAVGACGAVPYRPVLQAIFPRQICFPEAQIGNQLGVSPDTAASHDKFTTKHNLAVALAADPERSTIEAYGVWKEKSMYGRKYFGVERSTFLIGRDGRIAKIWRKVKVPKHAEEVLKAVEGLSTGSSGLRCWR